MSRLQGVALNLSALVSGSMILGGRICGCIPAAAKWAWDMAAKDLAATAERQEEADAGARKRAAAKAKAAKARRRKRAAEGLDPDYEDEEDGSDPEKVTAPPVAPVVRGRLDTWGVLGIGTGLAAFGTYAAWMVVGQDVVAVLAPHQPLILCGGGLAWIGAALAVAPPPAPGPEDDHQEHEETDDGESAEEDYDEEDLEDELPERAGEPTAHRSPGDQLMEHVLRELAGLEATYAGKGGLHVVSLIASAEALHVLSPGQMTKKAMRDWLEASKVPVDKSVRQPKGTRPIGSEVDYGVKVEQLTAVLGSTVSEAVRRMYGAPVGEAPPAPAPAPVQTPAPAPAEAPLQTPAEASPTGPGGVAAGGVPGPRLRLVQPLSPDPSQGSTQDTA